MKLESLMRNLLIGLVAVGMAGCFSSSAPESRAWMVAPRTDLPRPAQPPEGASAFGATRLGIVTVCAPYDHQPFMVHRTDGSVAADSYNIFASPPASLLRAAVKSRLEADGRFGHVVSSSSSASADAQVEITVTDLSLDCREDGQRKARAAISVDVIKVGRGPRDVAFAGVGKGEADAADGDYSAAFSAAFDAALAEALKSLK